MSLIGNTTNYGGLVVRARLDRRRYPIGKKAPAKELKALKIERDDFHGDWNYVIREGLDELWLGLARAGRRGTDHQSSR